MIPEQLEGCRFCKIKYKTKVPFEKNWQNKVYDRTIMQLHLENHNENYGVLTGFNNLGVLDDDSENKILMKLYEENFPETFRVRDHYYIFLKNWDGNKIILNHPTEIDEKGNRKHLGELQGKGQQIVGCGSFHPSGELYELKNNIPIAEVDFNKFKDVFKDYIKKEDKKEFCSKIKDSNWSGDDIKEIPISSIIDISSLKDMGSGCYQGSHPTHGSDGGMNFRVDLNNNTWYCFRCQSGGSSSELIGVIENIIPCSSSGSNCFSSEQGREVIEVAREKYGLRKPETQENLEPKGWALSINIKKMAERKGWLKCSNCNVFFEFNELMGWYKCGCSKGGIKKFLELFLQEVKQ